MKKSLTKTNDSWYIYNIVQLNGLVTILRVVLKGWSSMVVLKKMTVRGSFYRMIVG